MAQIKPEGLTKRQQEVWQLLSEGKAPKEIAGKLGISARTVEYHKYRLMEALNIHTLPELAAAYALMKNGGIIAKVIKNFGQQVIDYLTLSQLDDIHLTTVKKMSDELQKLHSAPIRDKSSSATAA